MKLVKTKDAIKMGEYKPTAIDKRKQEADFLIKSANGGSFTIDPKNIKIDKSERGVKEIYDNGYVEVTTAKLRKLEKQYSCETDF